jgi:PHD/YefM family antitoxin component YafN of YafNO toxin-antitoxin module
MERASASDERFVVDRRGEPTVVIMSVRDYINTVAPEHEVLAQIGEASRRRGTSKVTLREIGEEITAFRKEKRRANGKAKART